VGQGGLRTLVEAKADDTTDEAGKGLLKPDVLGESVGQQTEHAHSLIALVRASSGSR
jgi:hypothetical protein